MSVVKKLKKKADLEISTLVEIIIFAAIFLIIVLPIIVHMWDYFTEKPDSGTVKSFEGLIVEVNNLRDEREVPVYVDKSHIIKTFLKGAGPIDKCKEDFSCICICKEEGCSVQGVERCESVEIPFLEGYTINPALDRDGKAAIQNCLLKMDKGQIVILKCV